MIAGITPISFGHKSIIKTLFNNGELPEVQVDIYGKPIKPKEATLEHIIPKSKGGKSSLSNYAIANAQDNFRRSNHDIMEYTTKDNINRYLDQFTDIVRKGFDGNQYKKWIKNLFRSRGVKL